MKELNNCTILPLYSGSEIAKETAELYNKALLSEYGKWWYTVSYIEPKEGFSFDAHKHQYVVKDNKGKSLGYITLHLNLDTHNVDLFGAISFDVGNIIFAKAIDHVVDYYFNELKMNIQFNVVSDSPFIKNHKFLCKKYGGKLIGELKNARCLRDGTIHNVSIFQIAH